MKLQKSLEVALNGYNNFKPVTALQCKHIRSVLSEPHTAPSMPLKILKKVFDRMQNQNLWMAHILLKKVKQRYCQIILQLPNFNSKVPTSLVESIMPYY